MALHLLQAGAELFKLGLDRTQNRPDLAGALLDRQRAEAHLQAVEQGGKGRGAGNVDLVLPLEHLDQSEPDDLSVQPLEGQEHDAEVGGAVLKAKEEIAAPEPPKHVEETKVFTVVEQMPMFPGGDAALMSYLANNIHYPTVAAENGVQGRVVVGFVVERDGSITDVRILRGVDPSLDREAMRVVKSMPRWTPGKQNGSAVRVKYQVPVAFRLQ